MSEHEERGSDDNVLRKYLLGELTEEERAEVRERALEDPELFDRLADLENDLLDEWARGEATPEDRAKIEARLLHTPAQRRRGELARHLMALPPVQKTRPRRPLSRLLLLAASIAIIVTVGWFMARAQREQQTAASVPGAHVAAPRAPEVFAIALAPGVTRGRNDMARAHIPRTADTVRLDLALDAGEPYTSWDVSISAHGRVVTQFTSVRTAPGAPAVTVLANARLFAPGSYEVALTGLAKDARREPVGYYYLNVTP